jgi:hypothetical protein
MYLSTEWATLHYVDEACLEFKLKVLGFECDPVRMFSVLVAENSRSVLSAIASETGIELPLDWFDSN